MSSRVKVLIAVVVLALAAGGAGAWWFLRDDAPPPASLNQAVDAAKRAPSASGDSTSSGSTDPNGTWTIDAATRSSNVDGTDGTYVGFRIKENLSNVGSTTAVGRTGEVSGTLTIADSKLTAADLTVDMTNIETDRSQRKRKIYDALDADQFPTATFKLTSPVALPSDAATGGSVKATAMGDLTIHGVTKSVEIPIEAQLVNGRVVVVGSMPITFADFDVAVPSSPIVVSADDHGTLELQLIFSKQ